MHMKYPDLLQYLRDSQNIQKREYKWLIIFNICSFASKCQVSQFPILPDKTVDTEMTNFSKNIL